MRPVFWCQSAVALQPTVITVNVRLDRDAISRRILEGILTPREAREIENEATRVDLSTTVEQERRQ